MGTPKKEHLRELAETERAALQRIVRASIELLPLQRNEDAGVDQLDHTSIGVSG
jgi:hypothetical protein